MKRCELSKSHLLLKLSRCLRARAINMKSWVNKFTQVDIRITNWMARYGVTPLRISLGIVFFWFGFLKFFPNISPAQDLATRTIMTLSFGVVQPSVALPLLALWESLIGLGLMTGKFLRVTILLLMIQMLGTITPIFLF